MLSDCSNLIDAWDRQVATSPDAEALVCEDSMWTRRALDRRSRELASWLRSLGLESGDRVVLMLDNGADVLALFLGCHRVGLVPVPLSPRSSTRRVEYVVADCACRLLLVDGSHPFVRTTDVAEKIPCLTTLPGALPEVPPNALSRSGDGHAPASDLALIQYTSGSTSESKGVMVSHRALLANISGFTAAMALDDSSRFSSMLPLFHDMGLVCFGMTPLLLGHLLILHRQEALSLYQWLEAIGTYRVTHTGGPDSLLRIACRVVDDPGRYDLSSLRMLICGSEPVLAATLRAFGSKYGVSGALRPAYGMAELTLCATLTPAAEPWRCDDQGHVSSGRPIAGVDVRIEPPSGPGEIWVRTAALMDGYWGRPDGPTPDAQGFFPTGDLGYQDADGHLYVLGRLKNLIIRAGSKFSPHDLEAAAQMDPAVRRVAVVQPALETDEEDPVVAVLELDRLLLKDPVGLEAVARSVVRACATEAGLAPDVIFCISGGHLPTTENGKLRHQVLAESIRRGELRPSWSFPPLSETSLARGYDAA